LLVLAAAVELKEEVNRLIGRANIDGWRAVGGAVLEHEHDAIYAAVAGGGVRRAERASGPAWLRDR
jgi:hypothetical protein